MDFLSQKLCHSSSLWKAYKMKDLIDLLHQGAEVNARSILDRTFLHHAAMEGNSEALTLLIAAGADVDAVTYKGDTAMHLAAAEGYTKTVLTLIEAGADMKIRNVEGKNPLDLAVDNVKLSSALLLIAYGCIGSASMKGGSYAAIYDCSMRHAAVTGGFIDRLRVLLDNHPSDLTGDTPEALAKIANRLDKKEVAAVIHAHMAARAIEEVLNPERGMRAKAH